MYLSLKSLLELPESTAPMRPQSTPDKQVQVNCALDAATPYNKQLLKAGNNCNVLPVLTKDPHKVAGTWLLDVDVSALNLLQGSDSTGVAVSSQGAPRC